MYYLFRTFFIFLLNTRKFITYLIFNSKTKKEYHVACIKYETIFRNTKTETLTFFPTMKALL